MRVLPFSINYIINFIVSRCNTLRSNTFSRTENSMDLINFCLNIVEKKEIIAIVYTLGLILSQGYSRFLITSSISNLKKKKNSSNRRRKRIVVSLCEPGQLAQRVLERAYRSLSLCFSGTGCIARIGHQLSIGSIRHDNDFLPDATGGPLKSYIYISTQSLSRPSCVRHAATSIFNRDGRDIE